MIVWLGICVIWVKVFLYLFLAFLGITKLAASGFGWLRKLPLFLGAGVVCGTADAQLRLSVSETGNSA